MDAKILYNKMEHDFKLSACTDDWSDIAVSKYITPQYLKRYMGLLMDSSDIITYVYTAVFPSPAVLNKILSDDRREALLFVHHPMIWDITKIPVFSNIHLDTYQMLQERQISIYNLHTPLDANGPYSTSVNFAEALGVKKLDEFDEYNGVKVGIIGMLDYSEVSALKQRFEAVVGHEVVLYPYGESHIKENKVALVAGGGNNAEIYPYLREYGINTFVTGVARMTDDYPPSAAAHESAKKNKINILAGAHYSTEKFACIKMLEYFAQFNLECEFVPDRANLKDM